MPPSCCKRRTGAQHAFYVRVDQPECLFSQAEAKRWLSRLFALRKYQHLRGDVMPHLLLLSTPARFPFWAEQIERVTLLGNTSLPKGCIADYTKLASGAYAPIWLPFGELVSSGGRDLESGQVSLLSLLDQPATPGPGRTVFTVLHLPAPPDQPHDEVALTSHENSYRAMSAIRCKRRPGASYKHRGEPIALASRRCSRKNSTETRSLAYASQRC